jgi:uncharacterized PurR-regulated membrane protein YhhQ (DUF165 family)
MPEPSGSPDESPARARRRDWALLGGLAAFTGYIGTIVAANWLLVHVGLVRVPGTTLIAPAGVYAAGLAFTLRDVVQHALGRWATVAAILIGGALSYLVSPSFAGASATAFLISELADFAVYTPLRERSWFVAVLASNTVGLVIDSALFLWLAFGSLSLLAGEVVGKAWMTLAALVVLTALRRWQRLALA